MSTGTPSGIRPGTQSAGEPILPYGRQDVSERDVEAVVAVLRSEFLTQGPTVGAFERAIAERCETGHAVAVNSATSALHLACLALEVGPGDSVWTTSITFVASANCARYCGAEVEFVDIDPLTWNLSAEVLARKLETTRAMNGLLPKVVIAVHFAGEPCDMRAIAALGAEYGFRIVEDASHAFGARHRGAPVGRCDHSDIAVFSFHPVKILTSGEGGVAVTQDRALAERMRSLRSHGVHRPDDDTRAARDEPWRYEQRELGFNYRMTDIHASLGLSQLERVDAFLAHRHRLAERYDRLLGDLPLELPRRAAHSWSALHLYPVLVTDPAGYGEARRRVFLAMRTAGIGVNVHYMPVHTQPYYRDRGYPSTRALPAAEGYYARTLSLPLFGVMSFAEQDRVVLALARAIAGDDSMETTAKAA